MKNRPIEHRVRNRLAGRALSGALCFAAAAAWVQTSAYAQPLPATLPGIPAIGPATGPTTGPTTATASGRNGANSGSVTAEDGLLKINFRDASIDTVLDELSRVGGFSIVKTIRTEGRIPSMVNLQGVTNTEAINLLNTVLADAGYVALKQGKTLKIVPRSVARTSSIPTVQLKVADPNLIEPTDELVTCVIPLKYANATQLRNDLLPLINPAADFSSNQSSNALLMTDTKVNIRRVVEIVQALDTHLADRSETVVFQLKYATSTEVARLINELYRIQNTGGAGGVNNAGNRGQGNAGNRGGQGNAAFGGGGGGGGRGGGGGGGGGRGGRGG